MPKALGIAKSLEIVTNLDVQTLQALEEVAVYYSNRRFEGIVTGLRIMKQHGGTKEDK